MFHTARTLVGAATLASALFSFGSVAAHAGTAPAVTVDPFADCVQQVNSDLITEYGDLSLAAVDMGMTLAELNQSIADTCTEEVAGATAAATARQDAGPTATTVDPTAPVVQAVDATVLPDSTPTGTGTDSAPTPVPGTATPVAPASTPVTSSTTPQTSGATSSTPTPVVTSSGSTVTSTPAATPTSKAAVKADRKATIARAKHARQVLKAQAKAFKAHGHGRNVR